MKQDAWRNRIRGSRFMRTVQSRCCLQHLQIIQQVSCFSGPISSFAFGFSASKRTRNVCFFSDQHNSSKSKAYTENYGFTIMPQRFDYLF